jgi:purine-binding chemotaxis protein CheW
MDLAKIRKKLRRMGETNESDMVSDAASPAGRTPDMDDMHVKEDPQKEEPPLNITSKGKISTEVALGKPEAEKEERPSCKTEAGRNGKDTDFFEVLVFRLAKEEFAFRMSDLEEILRHQNITKVPSAPSYIMGITSLRGKIIPVVDLKRRVCPGPETGSRCKEKILILKGPKGPVGVAVDSVSGVVRLVSDEVLPPPSNLSDAEARFIEGVGVVNKRFFSIIHMEEAVKVEIR